VAGAGLELDHGGMGRVSERGAAGGSGSMGRICSFYACMGDGVPRLASVPV